MLGRYKQQGDMGYLRLKLLLGRFQNTVGKKALAIGSEKKEG